MLIHRETKPKTASHTPLTSLSHEHTHTHTHTHSHSHPLTLTHVGKAQNLSRRVALLDFLEAVLWGFPGVLRDPDLRKVDVRLPRKGNSNSHGARPMIKWFQTSRLSIHNSLSPPRPGSANRCVCVCVWREWAERCVLVCLGHASVC